MFLIELFKYPENVNILKMNLGLLQKLGFLTQFSSDTKLYKRILYKMLELFIILLSGYFVLGNCIEFYISMNDFKTIVICVIYILTHTKNVIKFTTFMLYREHFLKLIFLVEDNHFIQAIQHTKREISLVKSYKDLGIKIAQYLWIIHLFTGISTILNIEKPKVDLSSNSTSTEVRRVSVFRLWQPVKGIESPYFEFVTIYEFTTLLNYFAVMTIMNATVVALIIHITGQFSLLAECILSSANHMFEKVEKKSTKELTTSDLSK
ncbi:hypothetical protein L9F63_019889, partial [Diploptera punctata]